MTLRSRIVALAIALGEVETAEHMMSCPFDRKIFTARLRWLRAQ